LLIEAFPSSLYGTVTFRPFTLTRIFWPRLIFKSPTYREQKLTNTVNIYICLHTDKHN
jgi:hypothetical protein